MRFKARPFVDAAQQTRTKPPPQEIKSLYTNRHAKTIPTDNLLSHPAKKSTRHSLHCAG